MQQDKLLRKIDRLQTKIDRTCEEQDKENTADTESAPNPGKHVEKVYMEQEIDECQSSRQPQNSSAAYHLSTAGDLNETTSSTDTVSKSSVDTSSYKSSIDRVDNLLQKDFSSGSSVAHSLDEQPRAQSLSHSAPECNDNISARTIQKKPPSQTASNPDDLSALDKKRFNDLVTVGSKHYKRKQYVDALSCYQRSQAILFTENVEKRIQKLQAILDSILPNGYQPLEDDAGYALDGRFIVDSSTYNRLYEHQREGIDARGKALGVHSQYVGDRYCKKYTSYNENDLS